MTLLSSHYKPKMNHCHEAKCDQHGPLFEKRERLERCHPAVLEGTLGYQSSVISYQLSIARCLAGGSLAELRQFNLIHDWLCNKSPFFISHEATPILNYRTNNFVSNNY
jgi:hypothetical protein